MDVLTVYFGRMAASQIRSLDLALTNQCQLLLKKSRSFCSGLIFFFLFLEKYAVHSELTWNTAYCTTVFVFNYLFSFCMTKMYMAVNNVLN